jgi:hypothetical protein
MSCLILENKMIDTPHLQCWCHTCNVVTPPYLHGKMLPPILFISCVLNLPLTRTIKNPSLGFGHCITIVTTTLDRIPLFQVVILLPGEFNAKEYIFIRPVGRCIIHHCITFKTSIECILCNLYQGKFGHHRYTVHKPNNFINNMLSH